MAKGQKGRRRAPARRGGGWRRLMVAFVAGVLVAGAAGIWWLQRTAGVPGSWASRGMMGWLGMPRPAAATPQRGEVRTEEQRPGTAPKETRSAVTTAPARASENGARGVPGEPTQPAGSPPFGESEEVFEAGARVYGVHCATCHGRPGKQVAPESGELAAEQYWTAAGGRAVAREPVAAIFREIAEGRPDRQMPAYKRVLTEAQIWDVALLLKNADSELPDPVTMILRTGR